MDIDVAKLWNEMAWHHVIVCDEDSWWVHAASHTIDPGALLGKLNLWWHWKHDRLVYLAIVQDPR